MPLNKYADEMEREQARLRTWATWCPKAKAGHVTGGRVFGYANVEVPGATGRCQRAREGLARRTAHQRGEKPSRAHDFRLYADGHGFTTIAKHLNAERAPCPRPRPVVGKPSGSAPKDMSGDPFFGFMRNCEQNFKVIETE